MAEAATDVLARRLTTLARAGMRGSTEWRAVQDELASRRLQDLEPPSTTKASLRALLLQLLGESPGSTPTQLAAKLGRSTTVVSRVLTILLGEALVAYETNADDLRVRHYRLVLDPRAMSDSTEAASVPEPAADEEERQYLALVIAGAVRARRRQHALDYACDRLRRGLTRAESIGADDLALLARRELMTTLRQAIDKDGAVPLVGELRKTIEELRRITAGATPIDPTLYLPAIGSLNYELGRDESTSLTTRIQRLVAAATAFGDCKDLPSAHDWCPREGWALLSTAEIWRKQTEFGRARAFAAQAAEVFKAFDDTYGSAEAARIQGFSLRLQGEFDLAITLLSEAEVLATETSSHRCKADVLLQLGDAYRCSGNLQLGWQYLQEAAVIAEGLGRRSAHGFSLSAQAAIRFEEGQLDEALRLAMKADSLIAAVPAGEALNLRRWAVITRELAGGGDSTMVGEAQELFRRSLHCYQELGSPAGEAACLMGLGKLPPSSESDGAIDQLVAVAESKNGRHLLPIDPWVPSLLEQWASESGIDDVARVADETNCSDVERSKASEMAGEPRKLSLLAA